MYIKVNKKTILPPLQNDTKGSNRKHIQTIIQKKSIPLQNVQKRERKDENIRVFDTVGVGEDVAVRTFVIVDVGLDEGVFVLDTVGVCNEVEVAERLGVRVVDAGK